METWKKILEREKWYQWDESKVVDEEVKCFRLAEAQECSRK